MTDALALLREFEGFRETPYWDVNALRTGYGSDTVTLADGRVVPVSANTRVTREDAERDLLRRVNSEFAPRAANDVGPAWQSLTPAQQAALVSITYNYGTLPSSVARAAATGDVAATEAAIRALSGHNDGINADRRNREADIFASEGGSAGASPSAPASPYAANALSQPTPAAPPQNQLAQWQYNAAPLDPAAFTLPTNALQNPMRHFARPAR